MVFPLAKLGVLALKTFSKSISKRLKKETGRHPRLRQIIINVAQANHRMVINVQRKVYGQSTDMTIRDLNEENAVQFASEIIGDLFVFMVAVVAIVLEVQRSSNVEARKEAIRKQELQEMKDKEEMMLREMEILKSRIEELERYSKGSYPFFEFGFGDALVVGRRPMKLKPFTG